MAVFEIAVLLNKINCHAFALRIINKISHVVNIVGRIDDIFVSAILSSIVIDTD